MEQRAPPQDGAFPDATVGKSLIQVQNCPGPALRPVHRHADDHHPPIAAVISGNTPCGFNLDVQQRDIGHAFSFGQQGESIRGVTHGTPAWLGTAGS